MYVKCVFFIVVIVFFLFLCGGGGFDVNLDSGIDIDNDSELFVNVGFDDIVIEGVIYLLSVEVIGGDGEYMYNWIVLFLFIFIYEDISLF